MKHTKSTTQLRQELTLEAPYLRRYAHSIVSNHAHADDLVQDTLMRAIMKLHLFDQSRKLRPWLFRILHNLHVSRFRQDKARGPHVEFDTVREIHSSTTTSADTGLAIRDIANALTQLPIAQREVLVLVSLEGLRYSEVCEVLDIPLGTVMSRLSRARSMLRSLLDYEKPQNTERQT